MEKSLDARTVSISLASSCTRIESFGLKLTKDSFLIVILDSP